MIKKIITMFLILLIFSSCGGKGENKSDNRENQGEKIKESEEKNIEENIFEGLAEDSYGKYEGKIREVKNDIIFETGNFVMEFPKNTPVLNLSDLSFIENYDFKVNDKIIAFIKVGVDDDLPKVNPSLICLNNNPKFLIDMDKFHRVENFLLSTNNRIKVGYNLALSIIQIRDWRGEAYLGDPNLDDFLLIYKDMEEGMPDLARYCAIIKMPEGELKFDDKLLSTIKIEIADREKSEIFAKLLSNPKKFPGKEYDYFPLRIIFEEAGMEVIWKSESEIDMVNGSKKVEVNPKAKVYVFEGDMAYEISSLISENHTLYAPREFFEKVLNLLWTD